MVSQITKLIAIDELGNLVPERLVEGPVPFKMGREVTMATYERDPPPPTHTQPHQSTVTLIDQWKEYFTSPHTYLILVATKQGREGGARICNDSQKQHK